MTLFSKEGSNLEIDREHAEPLPDTMPERMMWLESLVHGIIDACKNDEHIAWLLSDRYFVGSYKFHCDLFELDHFQLRTKILVNYNEIKKSKNTRIAEVLRGYSYGKFMPRGKYKA